MHILLIDDNPDDRALVMRELRREFPSLQVMQVVSSDDFAQALAAGGVDLVITDYRLAWTDGLAVLRTVKERWPDCPVIMFTATGNEEVAVEAMKAGLDDYVIKSPKHLIRLPAAVRLVLEKKRERWALREAESRYRSFLQDFQGIAFQGQINYIPIFFHGAVEAITGYTEKEFTSGKPRWDQVIFPDDLNSDLYQATSEKLRSVPKYSTNREYRIIRKDGQIRWIHESIQNVCDNTGKPVLLQGVIYDITERKQAEEALKESEGRFRAVFENALDGILVTDVETRKFYLGNETISRMLGYSPKEIESLSVMDIHTEKDLPYVLEEFDRLARGEGLLAMDIPVKRKDDSVFYANITGFHLTIAGKPYITGIFRDITERKRAEEALQKNAEQMFAVNTLSRLVSNGLSLDQVVMAALNGVVDVVGPDLALIFLKQDDQLVLKGVYPDDPNLRRDESTLCAGECLCGLAVSRKEPVYSSDICLDGRCTLEACKKAGMRSFAALPLVGGDRILGVLGLSWATKRDFDHQASYLETLASTISIGLQNALLYEKVKRHAAELEQRVDERTAELKSFAYSVSHDLRAPLRAMQGFASALLEDYADKLGHAGKEYAHRIVAASQRMDAMIQDLLTYSRLTEAAIKQMPVSLERIVQQVLTQLEAEIRERDAEITVEKPLPQVMGNDLILVQVVTNLVTNAVKFVASGVRPKVCIRAEEHKEKVRLWVEDNGVGIDPKYQKRIFKVFERLHGIEAYPGTGIGLAIVRKGIEGLGGLVGVESSPGQGSRFWVELPKPGSGKGRVE